MRTNFVVQSAADLDCCDHRQNPPRPIGRESAGLGQKHKKPWSSGIHFRRLVLPSQNATR